MTSWHKIEKPTPGSDLAHHSENLARFFINDHMQWSGPFGLRVSMAHGLDPRKNQETLISVSFPALLTFIRRKTPVLKIQFSLSFSLSL